jgi:membrane protease YdiL (CAAX protease family)
MVVILYFLICLVFITLGSLTEDPDLAQFFVLPVGLAAFLFQKFLHRDRIRDLGFRACPWIRIGQSFALPIIIICIIFLMDFIFGFVHEITLSRMENPFIRVEADVNIGTLIIIIALTAFLTFVAALITEELGFRGYLINRLAHLGLYKALLISSVLFSLWHIPPSLILLGSGIGSSAVYVVNLFLLGILLGYLFIESKSILAPSLFHGVWNALEYSLFGYGNIKGVFLGTDRILFDPEEGLMGTVVLLAFSFIALRKIKKGKNSG